MAGTTRTRRTTTNAVSQRRRNRRPADRPRDDASATTAATEPARPATRARNSRIRISDSKQELAERLRSARHAQRVMPRAR